MLRDCEVVSSAIYTCMSCACEIAGLEAIWLCSTTPAGGRTDVTMKRVLNRTSPLLTTTNTYHVILVHFCHESMTAFSFYE